MKEKKTILITGASSGIGYDAAQLLAQQGHCVYAAARRVERMEPLKALGVHVIKMDVTEEELMRQGVEEMIQKEGHIDVLINNAGYGFFGAIETVPLAEAAGSECVWFGSSHAIGVTSDAQAGEWPHHQHFVNRRKDGDLYGRLVQCDQICRGGVQRCFAYGSEAFRY